MANATELPNPLTPLAFLPPALASQFEVSRYLYAATLGAYVWDVGLNLGNDYVLLFKHRVRFPTVVYFLSRVFTLAYILTCFMDEVAAVEDCHALQIGGGICLVLLQATTAMLFFLRVTAVWHPNKIVYVVFSVLWIAVLGAGITVPLGIREAHIGPTQQCMNTAISLSTEAVAIMPLINDSATFFAITYRILADTIEADSFMARVRIFYGGRGLSRVSRALLQSGQHFYLVAVAANIILLIALKLPHFSPIYHGMLSVPAFALINTMACLVFRKIKFGVISSDDTLTPITGRTVNVHATANPRSLPVQFHHTDPTTVAFESNTAFPLDIRVQREIYKFEDGAEACEEIPKPTDLA
ncbi:hypothetical protein MSAN_02308200 [Mycena sanguinolenta]|uniref:Uncharacterized protein n=1 Tax=Mycena sanguinolenta TaxID=230812 RepID=A0A8H6X7N1_9AGAR|nr:hypothetical protein MSAN_02308200 [Mycena sanguinolenta]